MSASISKSAVPNRTLQIWSSPEYSVAAMEEGTEEEKQRLMDKEQIPEAKKPAKKDGTR